MSISDAALVSILRVDTYDLGSTFGPLRTHLEDVTSQVIMSFVSIYKTIMCESEGEPLA